MSDGFDVSSIMSRNPPQPPDPLIPWQSVRADIPFVCVLEGPEVTAALREFRNPTLRNHIATFSDVRSGGGIPFPTWIDWTGFEG